MKSRSSILLLAALLAASACSGSSSGQGGASSLTSDGGDSTSSTSTGGAGGGADSGICPDWFGTVEGGACSVPEGTECGGNTGTSYTFLRCCNGHWYGASGSGALPCP
jgi:hypothetical protein